MESSFVLHIRAYSLSSHPPFYFYEHNFFSTVKFLPLHPTQISTPIMEPDEDIFAVKLEPHAAIDMSDTPELNENVRGHNSVRHSSIVYIYHANTL